MSFDDQYAWSHRVHLRLGEHLHYYVVNIRPYKAQEVTRRFRELIRSRELGGIRVFSIFGRHDILVRAWLHPDTANMFPFWLKEISRGAVSAYPFMVTDPFYRWTAPREPHMKRVETTEANRLLNRINNSKTIQALQSGNEQGLKEDLIRNGLIYGQHDPDGADRIQFFIALQPENPAKVQEDELARVICDRVTDNHPSIDRFTLDIGFGFCTLLCKGVVKVGDYFAITRLLRDIAALLPGLEMTTETLLVNETRLVAGTECIGDSTFKAIQGKDPLALQIVPELYSEGGNLPDATRDAIVAVLKGAEIPESQQKFVQDYLLGVIRNQREERFKSLAMFFMDLEYFLRENYRAFGGRLGRGDLRRVLAGAGITDDDGRRHYSIGTLLDIYTSAIKLSDRAEFKDLMGGWEELAEVRNDVVHGAPTFFDDWQSPLKVVLGQLMRLNHLRSCVTMELRK